MLVVILLFATSCTAVRPCINPDVTILCRACVHQPIAPSKFCTSGTCGSPGNVRRGMPAAMAVRRCAAGADEPNPTTPRLRQNCYGWIAATVQGLPHGFTAASRSSLRLCDLIPPSHWGRGGESQWLQKTPTFAKLLILPLLLLLLLFFHVFDHVHFLHGVNRCTACAYDKGTVAWLHSNLRCHA